ncbi:MAG: radical SAM protein, partial [Opitutaceae bacterium]
ACAFCYYRHCPAESKHWFHLGALMAGANRIRQYYGLEQITLSGGEPTIYPRIAALVKHCANIGLEALINTHGANNTQAFVAEMEDAGLAHWIVSLQGLQETHDVLTRRPGAWQRAVEGLRYPRRPVLINTTATAENMAELPVLAAHLREWLPPTVWHVLNFLPFGWEGHEGEASFAAKLDDIGPYLATAFEILEAAGWECNLQYYPLCIADRYGIAPNAMTFYQGQYNPWDWCIVHTRRMPKDAVEEAGGIEAARRRLIEGVVSNRQNERCSACRFQPICEMVPPGSDLSVLDPVAGAPVFDIRHFEKGGTFA